MKKHGEETVKNFDWNDYILYRYQDLDVAEGEALQSIGNPNKMLREKAIHKFKAMIQLYFSELFADFGKWLDEGKIEEFKPLLGEDFKIIADLKSRDYFKVISNNDISQDKLHLMSLIMKGWEQTHGSKNNKREIRDPAKAITYGFG